MEMFLSVSAGDPPSTLAFKTASLLIVLGAAIVMIRSFSQKLVHQVDAALTAHRGSRRFSAFSAAFGGVWSAVIIYLLMTTVTFAIFVYFGRAPEQFVKSTWDLLGAAAAAAVVIVWQVLTARRQARDFGGGKE